MDHQSTQFSRLGKLERDSEYYPRYERTVNLINELLLNPTVVIHALCLEEVTPEFLEVLQMDTQLLNYYNVVLHTKYNPRGSSFILASLILKKLNYVDYSDLYQNYYEEQPGNSGHPSRTQLFLLNNEVFLIHVHLAGLPGSRGKMIRQKSLQIVFQFLNERFPNYQKKVVIGDFNEPEINSLAEVYQAAGLSAHQDHQPTSYHRFIKHNDVRRSPNSPCTMKYEDKKGNKELYLKVDHLLHPRNFRVIDPFIFPTNFNQLETPYQAQVDPANLEPVELIYDCQNPMDPPMKQVLLIKVPWQVNFLPTYQQPPYWPSDHTLMGYTLFWV